MGFWVAAPARADTVTLHPTGAGYSTMGTPTGASTNWDAVNDQSSNGATGTPAANDGATTNVNLAGNNDLDAYTVTTAGNIPAGSTVTGLDVHAYVSNGGGTSSTRLLYRVNGVNTTTGITTLNSAPYVERSNAWTSLSLAESAWSTLEIGVQAADAAPDVLVTQVWVVVTYTPPAPVVPTLTSPTATSILDTTATLGANLTDNGGSAITARGTCWGTTANPTGNCVAEGGTGLGTYTHGRTGLTAGTQLYYRGYADNATGRGYSPDGSFYTEPATQASGVNFTGVSGTGMTVNWTRGSGSGVIVLMKAGSAVDSNPADGTYTGYTANTVFGSGTQIGTGNYVVYKSTGASVAVTGLTSGTTYYVAVYEHQGTVDTSGVNQGANYKLTPATGSQLASSAAPPTLTSPTATSILDTTATLGANLTDNGGSAITERGTCWGTTANPTGNCVAEGGTGLGVYTHARTGLTAGTRLYYRGYADNGTGRGYSPDGSFYTEPATQASGVNFTGVSGTGMTVNWTRGNGSGVIVLMKAASAVDSNPADGTYTTYTANTVFGSGTQLGTGNYVVYKSTGGSVPVTGLTCGTTYYLAVYEHQGTADTAGVDQGANYKLTPATGSRLTDACADALTASLNVADQGTNPVAPITGVDMQHFRVDSNASGNGSILLSTITVNDLGTAGTGDFDNLKIYIDTNESFPAGSVLIGQVASWDGTSTQVSLNLGTVGDRTVTNPTPKYIFIVYDLPAGAVTKTIQSQVTAVGVASPDTGATGLDFRSTGLTVLSDWVKPGTASASVVSCNRIDITAPFVGDNNTNSSTAFKRGTAYGTYPTTVCTLSSASPRVCQDTTAAQSTTYYYRVDFTDVNGVVTPPADPQDLSDPYTTPQCPPELSLLSPDAPGQPTGATINAGASASIGKVKFSANTGTITITSIGVENPNPNTALPANDVAFLQLFDDSSGNLLGTAGWTGALYDFKGLSLAVPAGSPKTVRVELAASTGATVGRTFVMKVSAADVKTQATSTKLGGPISGNSFSMGAGALAGNVDGGATEANSPAAAIINPFSGASVTGPNFLVQVQVNDTDGVAGLSARISTDNGGTWENLTANTNHDTSISRVFEKVINRNPGSYTFVAEAFDGTTTVRSSPAAVVVNAERRGGGTLLRRDNSSQFCLDCHAVKAHSSANISGRYGAWAVGCRDCHTPHSTTNIFLIRKMITPPPVASYQPARVVKFWSREGAGDGGTFSYVNPDNTGPCQVCHTRTQNLDGTPRWRNDGGTDNHYSLSAGTQDCTECHTHQKGFKPTGCPECHLGVGDLDNFADDDAGARIDEGEWVTYGHGRIPDGGGFPSGNPDPPVNFNDQGALLGDRGCKYCHTDQVGHTQLSNYFRLANADGPDGKIGVCLQCHKSSNGGYDPDGTGTAYALINPSRKVDSNHFGTKHGGANNHDKGGLFCWDCHEPHGDMSDGGSPIFYMLHSRPWQESDDAGLPTKFANAIEFNKAIGGNASGDCNTPPTVATTDSTKLDFRDYVVGGLCRNCHAYDGGSTLPAHYNQTQDDKHNSSNGCRPSDAPNDRCTECHLHNSGFAPPRCDSCHNAPPTIGKHPKHDENPFPADQMSYQGTASNCTTTLYSHPCVRCHNATHQSEPASKGAVQADPYVVQLTFLLSSDLGNYYDAGSSPTAEQGPNSRWFQYSDGTCQNYCHSRANPYGPGAVNAYANGGAIPTWTAGGQTMTCTSCHGQAAPSTTLSPTHEIHTDTTKYAFNCPRCHINTTTTGSSIADKCYHANGVKDVYFDSSGVNNSGGYADGGGATRTCSNTYCHSDGQDKSAPYTSGPSIAWGTSKTCSSCHNFTVDAGGPVMSSGKHTNHVNNAGIIGVDRVCYDCHSSTVNNTSQQIANYGNHNNGLSTVVFADGGTYNTSTMACTVYCHSSGQDPTVRVYRAPEWDQVTTLECNGCHGPSTSSGRPDYANGGEGAIDANSHQMHVDTQSFPCTRCHQKTTSTGAAINGTDPTFHLNGSRDVNNTTYIASYNNTTKECSAACHNNGLIKWGKSSATCRDCHLASGAGNQDVDDFTWSDKFNTGTGTAAVIDAEDWGLYGHGRDGGAYVESGNAMANLDNRSSGNGCLCCHSASVNHGDSTNYFRLSNVGGSDGKNGACLQCHSSTASGAVCGISDVSTGVTVKINSYHFGDDHSAADGGSAGRFCWDCHDPHGDYNYGSSVRLGYMIQERPTQLHDGGGDGIPIQFAPAPDFRKARGGDLAAFDWEDYVISTQTGGTYRGVCQVCHWNTARFRQTDGWPPENPPHNQGTRCTESCHKHSQVSNKAFTPAGGNCSGCHSNIQGGKRRALASADGDFRDLDAGTTDGFRSHHVGSGSTNTLQGTLTYDDCIVCHAEGTIDAQGNPNTTSYHNEGGCDGGHCINLRNVDDGGVFYFNKGKVCVEVCKAGGKTQAQCETDCITASIQSNPTPWGNVAGWGSQNATWVEQTRDNLDPFCLSCHDFNGARGFWVDGGNSLNPFNDNKIINNYDQVVRAAPDGGYATNGRVVDIASRVASAWSNGPPSGAAYAQTYRDLSSEPRGTDTRYDPPEGVYSRHAIRPPATTGTYFNMAPSVYGGLQTSLWDNSTYWMNTSLWGSNAVMGCADCHTVDGANGVLGNAHGSNTEYMLKDNAGGTAEAAVDKGYRPTYVCYRCHSDSTSAGYTPGAGHSGNASNWYDTGTSNGTNRTTAAAPSGNIYGFACGNCHGGGKEAGGPSDPTPQFGTIHGTSQIINTGQAGGSGTRQAYRFMNGNSMRYYIPATNWNGPGTCWTVYSDKSGTDADNFGGCVKHGGSGVSPSSTDPMTRPLQY
ncbi:MAG: CxxxxCH/CxxCH domain-containing protein [Myxococcales bacterium]|nr:CxxxxCH/CxxCH domain-containing protein [Myxococcales bacterium]